MFREDRATENVTIGNLFGEEEVAVSAYRDRAQIIDGVIRRLKRDRSTFETLGRHAQRITSAGNVLSAESNMAEAAQSAEAADVVQRLATTHGPVSDRIKASAEEVSNGDATLNQAIENATEAVREWVAQGGASGRGTGRAGEGTPPSVIPSAPGDIEVGEALLQRARRQDQPKLRATHSLSISNLRSAVERGTLVAPDVAVTPVEERGIEVREKRPDMTDAQLAELHNAPGVLFQTAWHGTPHRFDRFTTDAIGSGEGAQASGWGLYFAGKEKVADFYREKPAGRASASMEDLREYFRPGKVIDTTPDGWGSRVVSFNEIDPPTLRWSVTVETVKMDENGE